MNDIVLTEYGRFMVGDFGRFKAAPLVDTDVNQYRVGFHPRDRFLTDDTWATAVDGTDGADDHITADYRFTEYNWLDNRRKYPTSHVILQPAQSVYRTVKHFHLRPQCNGRTRRELTHRARTENDHLCGWHAGNSAQHQPFSIEHVA